MRRLKLRAQIELLEQAHNEAVDEYCREHAAKREIERRIVATSATCQSLEARKKALISELENCRR